MKKCTHIQNYRILIKRKGIQLFRINHIAPCLPPSQKKKQKKKTKCASSLFSISLRMTVGNNGYTIFFFDRRGRGRGVSKVQYGPFENDLMPAIEPIVLKSAISWSLPSKKQVTSQTPSWLSFVVNKTASLDYHSDFSVKRT